MAQLDAASDSGRWTIGRGTRLAIGVAAIVGAAAGIGLHALLQVPVLAPTGDGSGAIRTTRAQSNLLPDLRDAPRPVAVADSPESPTSATNATGKHVESEGLKRGSSTPTSYALSPAQIEALQVEEPEESANPVQDPVNIVLLGVDKLDHFSGNTDVIVLVSLRPEHRNALVLSVPRDLCIGACDSWSSRINYVFASEGPAALLQALSDMTGIAVDRYAAVNFDGFERIIDILGGAVITADRAFSERFFFPDGTSDVLVLREGENHVSGRQALMFSRSRKFDPAGDYARICRQQQVLASLKSSAMSPSSILAVPAILREVRDSIVTNLTLGELISLLRTAISIPTENIRAGSIRSDSSLATPIRGDDGAYLLRADTVAIGEYVDSILDQLEHPTRSLPYSVTHGQCSTGVIVASSP